MQPAFKPKQQVIHPKHGAGFITQWEDEFAGQKGPFLVVEFPRTTMMLRIPVAKVGPSGLRRLASPAEMRAALDVLSGPPETLPGSWLRHAAEYGHRLNSGEPKLLAGLVRDLNRPGRSGQVSKLYREALLRLAEELAIVEGVDLDRAQEMIEALLPPVH